MLDLKIKRRRGSPGISSKQTESGDPDEKRNRASLVKKLFGVLGGVASMVAAVSFLTGVTDLPSLFREKPASISGEWNFDEAQGLVLKELEEHEWGEEEMEHQILDAYHVRYIDRESFIVIGASNSPSNYCHACGPDLSFFEFVRSESRWYLHNKSIASLEYGQWGTVSAEELKVLPIGYNVYGVVTEGCGMNQGIVTCSSHIYANKGGKFVDVFWELTSQDYSGYSGSTEENWSAVLEIDKSGTGYYDIVLQRQAADGVSTSQRFKFDGRRYQEARTIK